MKAQNAPQSPLSTLQDRFLGETHQVENVARPLENTHPYRDDRALQELVQHFGGSWAESDLRAFSEQVGTATYIQLGFQANENKPVLETHDRYGNRTDLVKFHPAYHQLMGTALREGLHASPWTAPQPGAHVARSAKYYLHSQVEAAHCCPITMTFAAVPTLMKQPDLAALWLPKVTAWDYQPENRPDTEKSAVTIGMAMTEKQGGSDVRANSTRAYAIGQPGPGQAYELVGHKYFVSAPMCDAFLVLAHTERGLSCFLLPRWRPDGTKNPIQIQQLKNKMGNVANASCETELRGALAWMVGEEGKGVRNIIEMVALTRFDCMVGSASGMRQAVSQAIHHCQHRAAFGQLLIDQPLMQNVLADLALEAEAAITLAMRFAYALDHQHQESEKLFTRLGTSVGKYWICKRAPNHAYEAMECIGGSGVMETSMMPRLFRESPVNAIWEGSGNVQCLDMLRALGKTPDTLDVFFAELEKSQGAHAHLDARIKALKQRFHQSEEVEYQARSIVDEMALALQASLLYQTGNQTVADAFCASRLSSIGAHNYGTLPRGVDCRHIIERARPNCL